MTAFDTSALPISAAGIVEDDGPPLPKRLRKSKKMMSREAQFAVVAGLESLHASGLCPKSGTDVGTLAEGIDPERVGAVCGADVIRLPMSDFQAAYAASLVERGDGQAFSMTKFASEGIFKTFPLAFLKNLPNMLAAHMSIAADARGPNNTLQTRSAAALSAISEAADCIRRGLADAMVAGGSSHRLHPFDLVRASLFEEMASEDFPPEELCRPFDTRRCGLVRGEGAALVTLERRSAAESRGATILAEVTGIASTFTLASEAPHAGLARAIRQALATAGLEAKDVGQIVAEGRATHVGDALESAALAEVLPGIPVTTPSGWMGHLEAAAGSMQLVWALLGMREGRVLPSRNCEEIASDCPIPVARTFIEGRPKTAVVYNLTSEGQAVAIVLDGRN